MQSLPLVQIKLINGGLSHLVHFHFYPILPPRSSEQSTWFSLLLIILTPALEEGPVTLSWASSKCYVRVGFESRTPDPIQTLH